LDITGDDSEFELLRPVDSAVAVEGLATRFNFSAKFMTSDVMYMCSKYWVRDLRTGWWHYMADPVRKLESLCSTVYCADEVLVEKWVSLGADLWNYDDDVMLVKLAEAVKERMSLAFTPLGLVRALARLASSREAFFSMWEGESIIG